MNNRLKIRIMYDWKMMDAFNKGVAGEYDNKLWMATLEGSSFRCAFSYYTSVDRIYTGMLDNVTYYLNNCTPQAVLDFYAFYQQQSGRSYSQLYESSINVYIPDVEEVSAMQLWWKAMFKDFRYDYSNIEE